MCQGDLLFQTRDFAQKTFLPLLSIIFKPLAQNVKSYVRDTNDFLSKLASLPPLPDDVILCAIVVAGLYSNILHDEGLVAMRKALDLRKDERISTISY